MDIELFALAIATTSQKKTQTQITLYIQQYNTLIQSTPASSVAVYQATTVLEKVFKTVCMDVSACINIVSFLYCIECTAFPTPPRNVTARSSQTSLLIEWMEPEQDLGRFLAYYVVCGTQTRNIRSITETAVNFIGLSVFTRYECCVTVIFYFDIIESIPTCMNATTAPGMII